MTGQPGRTPDRHDPSPERGVLDEALEPAQIRSLNSALRRLSQSDGASKDLQDAAKRLLTGRLALRDALDDPAMARALGGGGMESLRGRWESLSEEERERIRRGETPTGGGPAGAPSEPRKPQRDLSQPRKGTQGRHSGGFSLY
ncbi:hypothetical protein J7I94_21405 [Streptomyces sp. ISL-12]|uniref:hypothetical protein n=1 Tax=Streptomyces sp. ISL-12 TaxID=2819177 RepID=UPI001BE7E4EA|nr:hypothetical protein [Streptomyces sp. ISL-12]MBT2413085.1 hypothetical protein [Streptomyces sp. ISL-12]